MTRVQRVHRLQVVMMIVNVVQPAVSPGVGVRRRGLAGYAGADVMVIDAGVTGRQAARRAAMVMATQRARRQTTVDVNHVAMNRG